LPWKSRWERSALSDLGLQACQPSEIAVIMLTKTKECRRNFEGIFMITPSNYFGLWPKNRSSYMVSPFAAWRKKTADFRISIGYSKRLLEIFQVYAW
jgi:hypothetical protein